MKFLRPEELTDLKGDPSKLMKATGWKPTYTFETMLDEMIEYWKHQLDKVF
jgi:GDP-D-mannose dehydratase